VPVSGRSFERYGGNTTCIEVVTAGSDILILDAGTGIRELGNRLLHEKRTHIHLLLTHFHWDHIQGFPFFKPAYQKNVRIDVYGTPCQGKDLRSCLEDVVAPPHFPIPPSALKADIHYHPIPSKAFQIGEIAISTIPLNHPNSGIGYKIEDAGKSFVFLTDNELKHDYPAGSAYPSYVDFTQNADLLIHDAEYMPDEYPEKKGWGHSTVEDAVLLAQEASVRQLGLYHHNQDRTDADVDALVGYAQNLSAVPCFGVRQGMEISL